MYLEIYFLTHITTWTNNYDIIVYPLSYSRIFLLRQIWLIMVKIGEHLFFLWDYWYPWTPWTSSDICPRFQSHDGSTHLCTSSPECNGFLRVGLVQHMRTSWHPAWWPICCDTLLHYVQLSYLPWVQTENIIPNDRTCNPLFNFIIFWVLSIMEIKSWS